MKITIKPGLFAWNGATWTRVGASNTYVIGIYHSVGVYNPVHKVVLFGGGNNATRKIHKLDSSLNVVPLGNAPIDIRTTSSIVTVDPASGDYLVFGEGKLFYKYDITTDTWTQLNSSSVPIFGGSQAAEGDIFGVVAAPVMSPEHNTLRRFSTKLIIAQTVICAKNKMLKRM